MNDVRAVVVRWSMPLRPIAAALLVFATIGAASARADMPSDCATAETAMAARARALLWSSEPSAASTLGYVLASAKLARGYCLGRSPERGVRLYRRVADTLDSRAVAETHRRNLAHLP